MKLLKVIKNYLHFKQILEQADLFQIISKNSDDVIWIYDLVNKKFSFVSPSVKKLRGLSPHEALNQSLEDRLIPESRQYVDEQIPLRIAAIESGDFSQRVAKDRIFQLHKNGTVIPTEVITNFVVNGNGNVTKLIGISRDITENLRAEEKLKKAYDELNEKYKELQAVKEELYISNNYMKYVFDAVNDAILIYNINTEKIIEVNERMCTLFEYSYKEVIELEVNEISFNPIPVVQENVKYWLDKAIKEGAQTVEWLFKKKSGGSFWGEVSFRYVQIGSKKLIVAALRDITERKNATLALQQSGNQLQAVLDTSLDAITLTNQEGIFLACNKTLLKRWNKTRDEMLNHSASEFLPPNIFNDRLGMVSECISTKTDIRFIDYYNNHYFDNTISPIIDTDGEVRTVALFSRDITEKKLAEIKLQTKHDLLVNILESMTDAFVSLDTNWCYTYMNKNAGKIFNREPAEMIGKHIWTEFPEGIGQPFHLNYERAMREQVNICIEEYYPPYDRWFENRIYPSKSGLSIFFQDITERKKAEESLHESETRYRYLFEHNPLPMLIYERVTFKILMVNEAFTIHYDYSLTEIQSMVIMDLYPEEEKTKIMQVASELKGHANVGEWHHIKKNGTVITIIAQSHDLNYMGKSARVAVIIDISDRKLVEMEILKLNKELEHRVATRTSQLETAYKDMESFSYSVSHDLRAPLRAITGFSEIISKRHRSTLNSEVQHYLDNIIKASHKMGLLIDDLLIYSRLGRQGVSSVPIPLNTILDSVANDFSIILKEINGKLDISNNIPVVDGDKSLLIRVFTNLIENAIKYRKSEIPLTIKIWTQTEGDHVKIYVSDNGIGISPEHHKRIFNMFQRLHSDDKYPGTGIGLSTVKKSLELINGSIAVESGKGIGSTFIVELLKG